MASDTHGTRLLHARRGHLALERGWRGSWQHRDYTRGDPSGSHPAEPVDDHERRADEDLRPRTEAPQFPDIVLESVGRADGLFWIRGVPTRTLLLRLACEPFAATVVIPESIGIVTVRARVERTSERSATDAAEPATFRALDAARFR